jgi:hypothetical protein
MQSVTYSQRLRQVRDYLALAEQATAQLEMIPGSFAHLVSAEWDLEEDERGRRRISLRLWDPNAEVRSSAAPEALKDSLYLNLWVNGVWGDLLAVRSDQQHRRVMELIAEMGRE